MYFPEGYKSNLDLLHTEIGIKIVKDTFEKKLAEKLNLTRVSAPLMVAKNSGLNDNLNGVERPISFTSPDLGVDSELEIVHSLAKWKRLALKTYGIQRFKGLYTDMNAIRRDERMDNLHSIYVDQWDWEKVIAKQDRTMDFLKDTVRKIVAAMRETQYALFKYYPELPINIPDDEVFFITSQELLDRYPELSAKEREVAICKEHPIVFLSQIGDVLSNGQKHDGRAPDYDDWTLNGDILVWYELLQQPIELSSMGIRVDKEALLAQLKKAGCEERAFLPFHSSLLNDELPLTMGGGIGQSRMCMVLLNKAHVGEVQASIWPGEMVKECHEHGIELL